MEDRIRAALSARFDQAVAQAAELTNLGGHASLRIYWRVELPGHLASSARGESTLMAMVMPLGQAALKSEEGAGDAPAPQELPFANVQRFLAAAQLPVPQLELIDMELGVVLLEDLGSEHFEDLYKQAKPQGEQAVRALYKRAIALLVLTQRQLFFEPERLPECVALTRAFDRELLRWELEHFREWGLHAQHGQESTASIDEQLDVIFDAIVEHLLAAPQCLVLRDYQSRNIMSKHDQLVLIDFQDALMGPAIYDLVALLRDSYIELEPAMVELLLADYIEAGLEAGLPWCQDQAAITQLFYVQVLQRKLKDAGRFIFIDQVKGNPSFLPYYEPSLGYVKHAISQLPEPYRALDDLLKQVEPRWPQ